MAFSYKSKFDGQEMVNVSSGRVVPLRCQTRGDPYRISMFQNMALITRKVKGLEQEMAERQASLEEAHKQIEQLNLIRYAHVNVYPMVSYLLFVCCLPNRGVVEKDLETAEIKLEKLTKQLGNEKNEK